MQIMNIKTLSFKKFLLPAGIILLMTCFFSPTFAAQYSPDTCHQPMILTNENFLPALLKSIDEAKKEIFISMYSFKTGENGNSYPDRIVSHLAKAVKKGVIVSVVLEKATNQSDELTIQNRTTGKLLEEEGIHVYFDAPDKTTHTKVIVIDRRIVILGSHNFTQSALKYNNEVSVLLESPDQANDVRNYILKIIDEGKKTK